MRSLLTLSVCIFITNCLAAESTVNYGALPTFSMKGNLQIVVEIPAGTNKKVEYDYISNTFSVDIKDGKKRVIDFLPYPGNYGFIPSTLMERSRGGDGDALDVLVLAQQLPVRTVVEVIPIAVLHLIDNGKVDDKIIAVPFNRAHQVVKATSFSQLQSKYPNVQKLIELWFTSYKGADVIEFNGWGNEVSARVEIEKWLVIN